MTAPQVIADALTHLVRNGAAPIYYQETTVIDGIRVTVQIVGMGDECSDIEPISSDHPAVIAYLQALDAARVQCTCGRRHSPS